MRRFIAIPLPKQLIINLEELLTHLHQARGIKAVSPENLHLTLLFLGKAGKHDQFRKLSEIEFLPFNLSTREIKLFPQKKPRLIWIELEDSKALKVLYTMVSSAFNTSGNFRAHITLARIKQYIPEEMEMICNEIKKMNPLNTDFRVESFNLYKSELTPDGPVYTISKEFKAKTFT